MQKWTSEKLARLNKQKVELEIELKLKLEKCREIRERIETAEKEICVCWAIANKQKSLNSPESN